MKYKIEKVKAHNSGNWRNYNKLRNEPGVMQELENVAKQIGELDTSYHAPTRAVAVAKVDKNTLERLIAQGKANRKENEE